MSEEYICVFGWDEKRYEELLSWVGPLKRASIVSRKEVVSSSPYLQIHHLQTDFALEFLAREVAWAAVHLPLTIEMIEPNEHFAALLQKCHLAAGVILSESADFSVRILKNAKANSGSFRRGRLLQNAFKDVPAVLVGAGPSLEKNGHLLEELKEKALIFSGGSALSKIPIKPHFACGIDPVIAAENPFEDVPFCYTPRVHPESIRGEKILFADSFSDAINWIYGEDSFDGGWTVGNFMAAIAVHLGCSPIILVGMDYCYERGKKYANGKETLSDLVDFRGRKTQNDWIMAAHWMEKFSQKRSVINATEGGILELEQEILTNVCKRLKKRQIPLRETLALRAVETATRLEEWEEAMQTGSEIVEEKLLNPLWHIWQPVFARADKEHLGLYKSLFYQKVLDDHK